MRLLALRADLAVVMTACINPGAGRVARSDPELRLADYTDGLRFWLEHPDPRLRRIVFADNSGYALDRIEDVVRAENRLVKDVRVMRAGTNDFPGDVHYGYGELSIIDEVVEQGLAGAGVFVKATGRLRFPGISRLLDRLPENLLFAVDCRRRGKPTATAQLFVMATDFYLEHVLNAREGLLAGDVASSEQLIYDCISPFSGQEGTVMRWPVNCRPSGEAAHWAKSYDSVRQRSIQAARRVGRRVAPNWWF